MAVTQQLARLPMPVLTACRASVEELDRLCSFVTLPRSEYLDLNWAPPDLIRVFELARLETGTVIALRRAMEGDTEINPAYRDAPDTVWEHPVNALEPDAVAEVATVLGRIDPEAVLDVLPDDPAAAEEVLDSSDWHGHPRPYLREYLTALLDFYAHAARRGLATALWWD
ncbi:hypothetical protein GCM10009557_73490 [Virgisporangium ochraceum]|uniref:DUF1877 domain-containing protein n=1 Tax=Virgisporangium ochraceum TaxID=65505 RepID=A0A8J4A2U3_9ACTN|nr:DUF1877 family protein [Virgisporangium ochraceum]GIJ73788.1 hypothetical protein Voc01_087050 [Virgisporangium ochraceum]